MPKYIDRNQRQGRLMPIYFEDQILPKSFEWTLCELVDHSLDLSAFDARYKNDETGAPAYNPRVLLKIVLYGYSRGIVSSRKLARACEENVLFMALAEATKPHFTTIADFVATMDKEAIALFREVLLVCDEMGLIGKEMFAIDGCKLPSNASKEWSGTKADFERKVNKMDTAIERMVAAHRTQDKAGLDETLQSRQEQYVATLRKNVDKIRDWLSKNDDKPGKTGKPRKSNITDNESAKMKTSHGVLQGYDGVAAVDGKHQVVVAAEAFGEAQEHDLLAPMVEGCRQHFAAIGKHENVFAETRLTADSGFCNEANLAMLFTAEIDAYVPDAGFRKRDPRFAEAGRHKERARKERRARAGKPRLFAPEDFVFADDLGHCLCPAGKRLYRSGGNVTIGGLSGVKFRGAKRDCGPCALRAQCLRNPAQASTRQVCYFKGRSPKAPETFTEKMKRKIDSTVGRVLYGMRMAIVEPVFANITHCMGIKRFTLRSKRKVNTQWNLFCIAHNLGKIHNFGACFT